jgi:hypothetical protein
MIGPDAPCPLCGERIHWSCYGKIGYAHCSQAPQATRLIIMGIPLEFCEWEGKCKRRPDGKVEIFYIEEGITDAV